jgi:hypothetical protein
LRSNYQQDGRMGCVLGVVIPFTSLIPPHFCACPKPRPGFPLAYVMIFFVFKTLHILASNHRDHTLSQKWISDSHIKAEKMLKVTINTYNHLYTRLFCVQWFGVRFILLILVELLTNHHDITEILLKVALNTIIPDHHCLNFFL